MFLADPVELREQLGFEDMTDITDAVCMALDAAEPILASLLNTEFTIGTGQDTFYLKRPSYVNYPMFSTEFRLSHGLITSMNSVVKAILPKVLGTADAIDIMPDMEFDLDKGSAKDVTNEYCHQFVRFNYTYGFPVSGSDPRSYDLTVVPNWLKQAAKTQALLLLADHPTLTEANIKLDKPTLSSQLRAQLARKVRYLPCGVLPL